jgi:DNA-damage-inducible protein J
MAQAMVNFRMDEELKTGMEQVCKEMGLSMTAAFTIFATKVNRERRIPFEVAADPFYAEANLKRLKKSIADIEAGRVTRHALIETDNE